MRVKKQIDINECGLVLIQSLHHKYYNKWIDINVLKKNAQISEKGMTIANLIILGKEYGIELEAYKGNADDFLNANLKGYYGCIFNKDGINHYVLFKKIAQRILIVDPLKGKRLITHAEFTKKFGKVIFDIKKSLYTKREEKMPHPFSYLFKTPTLIFSILLLIFISIALTFAATSLMKIIVDSIIPGGLDRQLIIIILIFIWIAFLQSFSSIFKSFFTKKLKLIIEVDLTLIYFSKIRNANILDLRKINTSDHLRRLSLIESSSSFISNIFFALFGELVTLIISVSILAWINTQMLLIIMVTGFFLMINTFILNLFIKDKYESILNKQLKFLTSSIDNIMSLDELKEPAISHYFKMNHTNDYFQYKKSEYSLWKIDTFLSAINQLIVSIIPIILIYIGTTYIFDDKLSVGSMIMFVSVFHSFINPLESLTHMLAKVPLAQKNLKLISYILGLDEEVVVTNGMDLFDLRAITLADIRFGYDRNILKINNFKIDNNLHITGKNGSGKSSFLNLISTRYRSGGTLTFNDIHKNQYHLEKLRSKIFLASPNTYLPATSIYEYITLGDKKATDIFNANIINYRLHSLMSDIGLTFEQQIIQNGINLSSGQRQLVILLRLFAFGYELILLDEALENVDNKKVQWLAKSINEIQTGIFVEISHSKKFIAKAKEVDINEITKN
ncbi:Mbov_0121 family peptidase domain-containing ABC transporter [Candidatus Mycoplasma mahonii]|uniref:Mbov_0121 family peptidase domain-containing ABC transporter n=1 Tax=Candidatus Mycoplasma mahonii TaxID=3004105 RepID=UPI0026EBB530|nr:cysteine peptidase family C39 domain-containing protein [Candidatus Mycoplasma mahonii]WKX02784.1 cysteine peptidase family C39 domain-containing protein [Candidatus Mycoplasma mahonii]